LIEGEVHLCKSSIFRRLTSQHEEAEDGRITLVKKTWVRFEEWLAEAWCDVGTGRRSPASGARWQAKEDVRGLRSDLKVAEPVMIQAKSGDGGARIARKDLDELVLHSSREGRKPYVAIAVGDLAFVGEVVAWR
jgi:hypothetical protein